MDVDECNFPAKMIDGDINTEKRRDMHMIFMNLGKVYDGISTLIGKEA